MTARTVSGSNMFQVQTNDAATTDAATTEYFVKVLSTNCRGNDWRSCMAFAHNLPNATGSAIANAAPIPKVSL